MNVNMKITDLEKFLTDKLNELAEKDGFFEEEPKDEDVVEDNENIKKYENSFSNT